MKKGCGCVTAGCRVGGVRRRAGVRVASATSGARGRGEGERQINTARPLPRRRPPDQSPQALRLSTPMLVFFTAPINHALR